MMSPRTHVVGKGLLALPGVFIRDRERLTDALHRGIKEKASEKFESLLIIPCGEKIFDHPDRSLRGRIATNAVHIKVPSVFDYPEMNWVDMDKLDPRTVFEDHWHIAKYFTDIVRAA